MSWDEIVNESLAMDSNETFLNSEETVRQRPDIPVSPSRQRWLDELYGFITGWES